MERRERYDPEDIENLLHERSFNELLAEERAYVLRHLNGKEEYEAMRALLLDLRRSEHGRETITADELIRSAVMSAFREQHKPQWKVWLNSVGNILLPSRLEHTWRPVLAFGTVAVLIVAGIFLFRQFDGAQHVEMAKLKRTDPASPVLKKASGVEPMDANGSTADISDQVTASRENGIKLDAQEPTMEEDLVLQEEVAPLVYDTDVEMVRAEMKAYDAIEPATDAVVQFNQAASSSAPSSSYSYAESALTVKEGSAKAKRESTASGSAIVDLEKQGKDNAATRTLGQDPELFDLMAAGW